MKTIAQSSRAMALFETRRAISFQNWRTRAGRLHQSVGAGVFSGLLSRHSRRSGNPEPFLCADTVMATGKRQAWASLGHRSVLKRQKGLWIPAAAGITGDNEKAPRPVRGTFVLGRGLAGPLLHTTVQTIPNIRGLPTGEVVVIMGRKIGKAPRLSLRGRMAPQNPDERREPWGIRCNKGNGFPSSR